jgi:AcrR family transcriptional regulator
MPTREQTKTPARSRDGRSAASRRRIGSLHGSSVPRARIMNAMLEIVYEDGYGGASINTLIKRSHVSGTTLYKLFNNVEDVFVATFDECVRQLQRVVAPAYQREGLWAERIRAALEAALRFLEHDRQIASLLFLEAPKAGPAVEERRRHIMQVLRVVIDSGRSGGVAASSPPHGTSEVVVEGMIAVVRSRVAQREPVELLGILNPLMSVLTYSYLGSNAANRELAQTVASPPATQDGDREAMNGHLTSIPMRLTYRTARVLGAIAQNPGGRNRDVAGAAGITDQGQVSRLLARLVGFGLIHNVGDKGRWTPNGWALTPRGEEVEHALRREFA